MNDVFHFYQKKPVISKPNIFRLLIITFALISIPIGLYLFNYRYQLTRPKADNFGQISFYISPSGNDNNNGTIESPFKSLEKARDTIRNMAKFTSDVYVFLRGGEYQISQPFTLSGIDSGKNGYKVIYSNYKNETPTLSGGKIIKNWQQEGNRWKTNIGPGLNFRQLYINETRAIRARSSGPPEGQSLTTDGFNTTNSSFSNWKNQSDIEVVGNLLWKQYRCPVQSISGGHIILQSQCFQSSQSFGQLFGFKKIDYFENAFELLDSPNEWYYDKSNGWLYLILNLNENANNFNITIPVTEQLIVANGTPNLPVSNISFKGLTFKYTSWSRPSSGQGWSEIQTNLVKTTQPSSSTTTTEIPRGVINLNFVNGLEFTNNIISHIGSAGIVIGGGSKNNLIKDNNINDISSGGIFLGDVINSQTKDLSLITSGNKISNNYIYKIGQEFQGAAGLWAGYVSDTLISNNTIFDIPYSGISIGWGWGSQDPSVAKNNIIENNLIYNHVSKLIDGGGIYSLSSQSGNIYRGNLILNQKEEYGALYLDNGSRYITVENNAIFGNKRSLIVKGGNNIIKNNYLQNRYTDDIWNFFENSKYGPNTFSSNHNITNINSIPSSIINSVGSSPFLISPDKNINPGVQNISWVKAPSAKSYLLRINDMSDPWTCSLSTSSDGDVCTGEITSNSYSYNFKPGHSYNIWVHAVNSVTNTYGPKSSMIVNVANPSQPGIQNTQTNIQQILATTSPTPTPLPSPLPTSNPLIIKNLTPIGSISSQIQKISWDTVPSAKKYYVRVDDRSDPWVCANMVTPSGDTCVTTNINSYNYNFKSGHKYNIWIHAVYDDAGTSISPASSSLVTVN